MVDRQTQKGNPTRNNDVKDSPSSEEIEAGEKAEELFQDFCDDSGITYLYIDQSSYNKSSRLVKGKAARPDFLIMEPHKMPIFIDVKAHQLTTPGGEPNFFLNGERYQAVFLHPCRGSDLSDALCVVVGSRRVCHGDRVV
jgi:hypothetical protein